MSDQLVLHHFWVKLLLGALGSAVVTAGTTAWSVRGYFDKLEHVIEGQQVQINDLIRQTRAIPEAEKVAVNAQRCCDVTSGKLEGHLRPDTSKGKQ